jgi:hypothetical protein
MKLAYWYPASTFSAWSISLGAVDALRRMGHEVIDCGVSISPGMQTLNWNNHPSFVSRLLRWLRGERNSRLNRTSFPSSAQLSEMDGIIISGPEHMGGFIATLHPEWEKIRVPKAAWMHETVTREDYGSLNVESIKRLADTTFCPAIQDEAYGFRFLPFGVDTHVFRPEPDVAQDINACFIGLMYPKRRAYLEHVTAHLREIDLKVENIQVEEGGIVDPRKTVLAYAAMLRRIKVFVNLPTLSQLLVTKIYEVTAAGTCMVTPVVKGIGGRNHQFLGENVCLYDEDDPIALAKLVRSLLGNDDNRVRLAATACDEMHSRHCIELRLQKILNVFA